MCTLWGRCITTPKEWMEEEKPADHSKHLCNLLAEKIDAEEYKNLVKNIEILWMFKIHSTRKLRRRLNCPEYF